MREYVFKIFPAPGSDRRCSTRTLSYIITIELHAFKKFVFKKVVKIYVYMSDYSNHKFYSDWIIWFLKIWLFTYIFVVLNVLPGRGTITPALLRLLKIEFMSLEMSVNETGHWPFLSPTFYFLCAWISVSAFNSMYALCSTHYTELEEHFKCITDRGALECLRKLLMRMSLRHWTE